MQLREWFASQTAASGLELTEDGNGNQIAWWGHGPDALLIGSHLDSVPEGGPLDGPLGVVSALDAVGQLNSPGGRRHVRWPWSTSPMRRVGGLGVACLGSRLATGAIAPETALAPRDEAGNTLGEVLRTCATSRPPPDLRTGCHTLVTTSSFSRRAGALARPARGPLGVATAIWPHGRYRFDFCGQATMRGPPPWPIGTTRCSTYAATVLAAREVAAADDQRATVGRVVVNPGSTN